MSFPPSKEFTTLRTALRTGSDTDGTEFCLLRNSQQADARSDGVEEENQTNHGFDF